MELTPKSKRAVKAILNDLTSESCTVKESREILAFTQQFLESHTVVHDVTPQIEALFADGL